MRVMWKSMDKMRCFRKRSIFPFLGFLIAFLLFFNHYMDDGYVLVTLIMLLFVLFFEILTLLPEVFLQVLLFVFACLCVI